jgi:flagellar P-ring protein precursor FlgI
MKSRKYIRHFFVYLFVLTLCGGLGAEVSVKLKDISFISGLKNNQLYGYGLVVGLQGTGDSKSSVTKSSLKNLLKNLGMEGNDLVSKNSAAVLLTGQLPPFVRVGERIDITVSSIGDAKSLEGGILVQSPLRGADNVIYAVAQGALILQVPEGRRRGVKTVAVINGGGVIEREIIPNIVNNNSIYIVLKNWDYSLTDAVIKAIQSKFPGSKPQLVDGKIRLSIQKETNIPEFISTVQNIEITPALKARIVINERSGTIAAGGSVKISEAMVSREGITVEISGSSKKGAASHVKDISSVKDLVDMMNSIGASTADIIAILKALQDAGALYAELIVK